MWSLKSVYGLLHIPPSKLLLVTFSMAISMGKISKQKPPTLPLQDQRPSQDPTMVFFLHWPSTPPSAARRYSLDCELTHKPGGEHHHFYTNAILWALSHNLHIKWLLTDPATEHCLQYMQRGGEDCTRPKGWNMLTGGTNLSTRNKVWWFNPIRPPHTPQLH